jgi:glycosyltransferase involved in cell wall biosynthesis
MADSKISIITVCFNCAGLIEKTIKSVICQTHPDVQYIIIDGGSTDNTPDIIGKYREYIDIVLSEKDDGIYDAMNKGLGYATGDLVYFLNAGDCLYDNDVLGTVAENLRTSPESDILYGDYIYYDDIGEERCSGYRTGIADLISRGYCHQTTFARKSIFDRCGNFNTNYTIYADFDWLLRALRASGKEMHYIDTPVVYYLRGGESESRIVGQYHEKVKVIGKNMGGRGLFSLAVSFPIILSRYLLKRLQHRKRKASAGPR